MIIVPVFRISNGMSNKLAFIESNWLVSVYSTQEVSFSYIPSTFSVWLTALHWLPGSLRNFFLYVHLYNSSIKLSLDWMLFSSSKSVMHFPKWKQNIYEWNIRILWMKRLFSITLKSKFQWFYSYLCDKHMLFQFRYAIWCNLHSL